ncbi:MAG: hypothetical protein AAB875_06815 [Patescibacteria group bacterium]
MKKGDIKFILTAFLSWRVLLLFFVTLGALIFPLQQNFLGGGIENYLKNPYFWAWSNFDGEHYASIAQHGYGNGEQAFFPLYPILMKLLAGPWKGSLTALNFSGLLISNVSFLLALLGLYKLVRLDFSDKISKSTIFFLLLFPTSFYFGAVYTESPFLAIAVWTFYFARKAKWFYALILGGLASGARFIGIVLLPALIIEWWKGGKKNKNIFVFAPILAMAGLIFYMIYLNGSVGDPLAFIKTLPGFGEQRSATPIILPRVFYRYFFKILPSLTWSYFPVVFTTLLELSVSILFVILALLAFFKLRLSYAVYLSLGYLLPTLSGSFSSLPRYVIVLFPAFILLALWLNKRQKIVKHVVFLILFVLLSVACALFVRGFWVS